jgi:hypothetical protein
MKLMASAIKPGMVICIKRNGKWNDYCLVTAISGYSEIEYTHLDYQDSYGGLLIGSIKRDEVVKVMAGKERKLIISKIKDDVFRNLHDIENVIDTIRLIEAMGKQ